MINRKIITVDGRVVSDGIRNKFVHLHRVSKGYPRADGSIVSVLKDCSMEIEEPQIWSLVGPNGAGKSTVLHLLADLIKPDSGTVTVTPWTELDRYQPMVGYVWQNYRASLLPWLSVADNISFGLKMQGRNEYTKSAGYNKSQMLEMANILLKRFAPRIAPAQKCYELSGGQQQMVSLMRSFAMEPDVLLLDEPTSALDASARWGIVRHLEDIWASRPIPVIYVCHDVDEAVLVADKIALLSRHTGQLAGIVENHSERPRSARMLASAEHVRCRREVLDFLLSEGDFENGIQI